METLNLRDYNTILNVLADAFTTSKNNQDKTAIINAMDKIQKMRNVKYAGIGQ